METSQKSVLLFGGGGCHDFKAICPVLKDYLDKVPGFAVEYVPEDKDVFLAERLAKYDLAVVYHTGGELTPAQYQGLTGFVAAGKGFAGVHSAADSFRNSPEYLAMVGGVFIGHPFIREYIVALADPTHPVTKDIQGYTVKDWEKWPVFEYKVTDEQYLLDYDPRVHVLATTVFSGTLPRVYPHGALWPVAWVKPWHKGRVFYLGLGHNVDACRNGFFREIFTGGVKWAAGE